MSASTELRHFLHLLVHHRDRAAHKRGGLVERDDDGKLLSARWELDPPVWLPWSDLRAIGSVHLPPPLPDSGAARAIVMLEDGRVIVDVETSDDERVLMSAVTYSRW